MKEKIKNYLIKKGHNPDQVEKWVEANFATAIRTYPNAGVARIADFILWI